jgi:hypothetical protein
MHRQRYSLEGEMNGDTARLTVRQAYEVMLLFLEGEADLTESEDLAELLSQYRFGRDGEPRDQQAWEAWEKAAAGVLGSANPDS